MTARASAEVVLLPGADLACARMVLAQADLHDDAVVMTACEVVIAQGSGREVAEARFIFDALVTIAVEEVNAAEVELRRWRAVHDASRRRALDIGLACLGVALALAALLFFPFPSGVP